MKKTYAKFNKEELILRDYLSIERSWTIYERYLLTFVLRFIYSLQE